MGKVVDLVHLAKCVEVAPQLWSYSRENKEYIRYTIQHTTG